MINNLNNKYLAATLLATSMVFSSLSVASIGDLTDQQYNDAIQKAQDDKTNAINKRDALLEKKELFDNAQDNLEKTATESKEKGMQMYVDHASRPLGNAGSPLSTINDAGYKADVGQAVNNALTDVVQSYKTAIEAAANEASVDENGSTDIDKEIEQANKDIESKDNEYRALKSWGENKKALEKQAAADKEKARIAHQKKVAAQKAAKAAAAARRTAEHRENHSRDYRETRDFLDGKTDSMDGETFQREFDRVNSQV